MADFETIEKVQKIIEELLSRMDVAATVTVEDSLQKGLIFNIQSPDSYLIIGRQGANLYALQTVAQAMVSKMFRGQEEPVLFNLDVDDYRKKREWHLKEAARLAVEKVKLTGRSVSMEPMPNFERKLVHAYIQDSFHEIETTSEGIEPYRKIVIHLKKLQ